MNTEKSITMLKTIKGSPGDSRVFTYEIGQEYPQEGTPLSDSLAQVFCAQNFQDAKEVWGPAAVVILDEPEMETKIDLVEETSAICGKMAKSGKPCKSRRPCRWHK